MADQKYGSRKNGAPKARPSKPAVAPRPVVAAAKPAAIEAPVKAEPVRPPLAAEAVKAPVAAPPKAEPVKAPVAALLKAEPLVAAPPKAEPAAETRQTAELRTKIEVNSIEPGAKIMTETLNNTVSKAQEATQQAAQQATEQFRGALNDANERGKVAIEKGARFVEELADLTRGNLEAFVASQKTAAKYVETLTQGAADYSRRSFEEASTALRSFSEAKSPTDMFRLQSDLARSAFDSMVSESARVSETVVKMTGEVAEPITSRYSVAAERLKAVAA